MSFDVAVSTFAGASSTTITKLLDLIKVAAGAFVSLTLDTVSPPAKSEIPVIVTSVPRCPKEGSTD
jgi:hypothetical protein